MSNNTDLREAVVEVSHIIGKSLLLLQGAGVERFTVVLAHTSCIDNMPAHGIETSSTIGNLPWVHFRILVVIHQALYTTIQMYEISIAHLLPSSAALGWRIAVPVPDVGGCHLPTFRRGSAVDYQIFHFRHTVNQRYNLNGLRHQRLPS